VHKSIISPAANLSENTHRVAISDNRLISAGAAGVTFKYKDYRLDGPDRYNYDPRAGRAHSPVPHARAAHGLPNGSDTPAEKLAGARVLIAAAGQTRSPANHCGP